MLTNNSRTISVINKLPKTGDDQKRTMTPEQARIVGADYIVVGRPITKAENPYQAYLEIKEEWNRIK